MKIKRPSICMKIKGISNLIHQELGTNRDTVHPGTMMQKMFLGYLEVHEDQPVFQKDLESYPAQHRNRHIADYGAGRIDRAGTRGGRCPP